MADLKPVKVHWEAIDRYAVFVTTRFEIMYEDQVVGYYRMFMEPESVNIAFYSDTDRHGVLPPETYKVIPSNHKMIRLIEEDLNKMGYTIPDGHSRVSDGMLVGMERFPSDWEVLY